MDTRSLYDTDVYAWAMQQASALRGEAARGGSNAVDWANVAEEIESLGNEQAHAIESHLANILEHLLKLGHSPANDPRNHWASEVVHQRARLERRLKKNPALRSRLPDVVDGAYQDGRRLAAFGLARDGLSLADLPETCPYTLDQIRAFDWFPSNPHFPVD
ncbi:MAG: DUF29 domain-containing protein [Rhodospirillales bacterium]